MKTIKQIIFAALAALMTVSPAFAAEQNQSWWSNAWSQIKNFFSWEKYGKPALESARQFVQQNPEKTAFIVGGTACVIGGAYALKQGYNRLCQNRIIAALQGDDPKIKESAKKAALENLFDKIWMPPANWRMQQIRNQSIPPQQQKFIQLLQSINTTGRSSKDRKELIERLITEAKTDYLQGKLDLVDEYILQQPYLKEQLIDRVYQQAIAESGKSTEEAEQGGIEVVLSNIWGMVKRYPWKFNDDLTAINSETDEKERMKKVIDFIDKAKMQYLSDSMGHGRLSFDSVLNNPRLQPIVVDRIIQESNKYITQ